MAEYKPLVDRCQNLDDTPSIYDQGTFDFPTRSVGVSTNPVVTRAVGVTTSGSSTERVREDIPADQAMQRGRSRDLGSSGGFGLDSKEVRWLNRKEWAFLVVSSFNFICTIALTIYRLVILNRHHDTGSCDFTFAILILVNSVFCIFYVVNGVLREDSYQLTVYIAAVCVVSYCTIEYSFRTKQRNVIKLVRLIVGAIFGLITVALAGFVIRDFGWIPFRRAGASAYLQRVYKETTRFFSLLIFDFQIACCLAVLVLKNGTDARLAEKIILGVSIPVSIFLVILGWKTVLKTKEKCANEHRQQGNRLFPDTQTVLPKGLIVRLVVFVLVALLEPAFVIYKLVKIYQHVHKDVISLSDYLLYTQIFACFLGILIRSLVFLEFHRILRAGQEVKDEPPEETGLLRGQVRPVRQAIYDIY